MAGELDYEACIAAIPTSFATVSIGSPETPLPAKISAIASAGFKGIELGFPDLKQHAGILNGKDIAEDDYDTLCKTASALKDLTSSLGLKIMLLQPFANFEGWPRGSQQRNDAFTRAHGWTRIMEAAGCDTLQVGSTDSEGISLDANQLAEDLTELADLLAQHGFRLAYENWCWSTHSPNWHDVWTLVQKSARPNIELCLDTFQSAGGEWGDPTTSSGRVEGISASELDSQYQRSLEKLSTTIPSDKIYMLQISDAYRMEPPLRDELDDDGLRPRGQWSGKYRPLPFEGGYLPIVPFARAVLKTGFRGWFSVEVFDEKAGAEADRDLEGYARRAMESYRRLVREATAMTA